MDIQNSSKSRATTPIQLSVKRHKEHVDVIVFSHLRWDFVFQRPQHLFSRFAKRQRVFYVEEPVFDSEVPRYEHKVRENGVNVLVPHLPPYTYEATAAQIQTRLIDDCLSEYQIKNYVLWYYTSMALQFTRHLAPKAVIYDCMDELSLFKNAHPLLMPLEEELLARADLVFTGGQNLYEHKRDKHHNIHAFPSSIDASHFIQARSSKMNDPLDQAQIPRPRIGFYGVIDERMDTELLKGVARSRPDWHLVILGPVVKIDPAILPKLPNIHYLGSKSYNELPRYLSGWDVAMLPFAKVDATRFISPTKTPEYLAAGRPVVSTSIRDVVRPYLDEGLVHIADDVAGWVDAIESALKTSPVNPEWLEKIDSFLSKNSWDKTWFRMATMMDSAIELRRKLNAPQVYQA